MFSYAPLLLLALSVMGIASAPLQRVRHLDTSISIEQPIKHGGVCRLSLVTQSQEIAQEQARRILIESFVQEYQQYLQPSDLDSHVTCWRPTAGLYSAEEYYSNYFDSEYHEYLSGRLLWVQAFLKDRLAGWATFEVEKNGHLYMNLLVVDPALKGQGIGAALVWALHHMEAVSPETPIHLLLRKKNLGGHIFYSKIGFHYDSSYQRADNFVDLQLLEGWTGTISQQP